MIRLRTIQGEGKGTVFMCDGQVAEIGRAPTNSIVLQDPMVSWRHGIIEYSRGRYVYRDLASKNGTTLYQNRKRFVMKGSVRGKTIGKNDELLLGATVLRVLEVSLPPKKSAEGKRASG